MLYKIPSLIKEIVIKSCFQSEIFSLPVGKKVKLPYSSIPGVKWVVTNKKISLINNQFIEAIEDGIGEQSQSKLIFFFLGKKIAEFGITIVPWDCAIRPEIKFILGKMTILGEFDGTIYFIDDAGLNSTNDSFKSKKFVARIPWKIPYRSDRPLMLKTKNGWFIRTDFGVIHSINLVDWHVTFEVEGRAMYQHMFCIERNDISMIFIAEYSTNKNKTHSVYLGRYQGKKCLGWENILEFLPTNTLGLSCRHIHVLTHDPYTDWIWVATGDSDNESSIYVSTDHGSTFKIFARGSQKYRTLMIQFTEKYVYWNMDTHSEDQSIFRSNKNSIFLHSLNSTEDVISPHNEVVATLPFGAQWYGIKAYDKEKNECIVMSAGPESTIPGTSIEPYRDWNPRVFIVKKLDAKYPIVQELIVFKPKYGLKGKNRRYSRVDPRLQCESGEIYFMGHNIEFGDLVVLGDI